MSKAAISKQDAEDVVPVKKVVSGATKMQYGMFKKAKIDENEEELTTKPTAKQLKDKKKSIFAKVSDIISSESESDQEKNAKKNMKNKKNIKVQ